MNRRTLLATPLLLAAAPAPPLAARPIARLDTKWWADRHAAKLHELKSRRIDLLWIGDSITQDWERAGKQEAQNFAPIWQRHYAPRHAINLGFKGDSTAHLLWRLRNGQLDAPSPKAAILLIGTNNFGRLRWSVEDSLAGHQACVAEIRRRHPAIKLLVLPLPPSDRGPWTTQSTTAFNTALLQRRTPGVTVLDTTALYHRNGALDPTQFYDPLLRPPEPAIHPTAQSHAKLAALIEPTLAAMLGDRPRS